MSLFTELKRRNVFRVAAAYIVVSWLVTEVGTTLLQTFGAPDWVAKAIILVVGLGFLPVVIFSWVYELTPDGIRKERHVERDESITSHTGRKLDMITIAAVIIGIAFLGLSKIISPPAPAVVSVPEEVVARVDEASVAVLPFVNMSGNKENEYFSDGLTETLLHMLAQIPELKVAARTSSFAFKGQGQDIRVIASALNVAHVLEGSVQRAGDRVRITAQLIRADDGFHVWSESYDRTLTDIFAIQDEIANDVGGALIESLLGADEEISIIGIGTENIAAYEMYLEALHHRADGSYGGLGKAARLLKEALSRDTSFNDAKVALAQVYFSSQFTGLMPEVEALSQASALLAQVVEANPEDVQARTWRLICDAMLETFTGNTEAFVEAIPMLKELVAEAPNEIGARLWLATNLVFFNRADEGFVHFEKALEVDALNPRVHFQIGAAYIRAKRYEEAIDSYNRSLELKPDQPNALADIGDAKAGLGDMVGYVDGYIRASEVDSQDHELPAILAESFYVLGLTEEGNEFLTRAKAIAPASPATRGAELTRTFMNGDYETAFSQAESMILDDVANRWGAFEKAVWTYAQIGANRGRAQEAFDFLEAQVPQIHDATVKVPLKTIESRPAVLDLWKVVMPEERLLVELDAVLARSERVGFGPTDNSQTFMRAYALRGDIDAAVQLGLETDFVQPISMFRNWRFLFAEQAMAEVAADPRVQVELIRLEQEEEQARSDLREYLANRM